MANIQWQCRNCGAHPYAFSGGRPASGGKCPVTGYNHVWEQY